MQKDTLQVNKNEELFGDMIQEIRYYMDFHQKNHATFSTDGMIIHLMKKFSVDKLKVSGGQVIFDGRKKLMVVSEADFPNFEELKKGLVKTNAKNIQILIADWNIKILQKQSYNVLKLFIKVLMFLEKVFMKRVLQISKGGVKIKYDE